MCYSTRIAFSPISGRISPLLTQFFNKYSQISKKAQEVSIPIFDEMKQKNIAFPILPLTDNRRSDHSLVESIFAGKTAIQIKGDREFNHVIRQCIHKLSDSRPGMELLERVCRHEAPLPIRSSNRTAIISNDANQKPYIEFDAINDRYFTTGDEYGRRFAFCIPHFICLAHEMIHYLHIKEEGKLHLSQPGKDVFPGFPNVEEEYTVTGVKPAEYLKNFPTSSGPATCSLSEHVLCEAYNIPKRDVYGFFLPQTVDDVYPWGGFSALHIAASRGQLKTVQSLISLGANVNLQAKGSRGRTPLMCAYQYHRTDVAKLLLESGSDPNIRDYWGHTASDYLVKSTGSLV